ncbi:MAG: two-component sensor histidine kinase [Micavibrio aeruginosavorus]|uniref:histidine kinase n=1 Tax=Micavibrio aeruginosavorus TaxID=349221 RepID=A0A2W5PZY7_9BACT|nr:MAG: two-component sensor histidine kinase [Micavibrio aeruginosavorus]
MTLRRILAQVKAPLKTAARKLLPRSLMARSLLILVMPIFLVQIITTYIFFDRHWQTMGNRLAFAIAGEISVMAEEIENDAADERVFSVTKRAVLLDFATSYKKGSVLQRIFYDNRKGFQNPSRENIIAQTLAAALDAQVKRPYDIKIDRDEKWVEISVQLKQGVLTVSVPQRRIFSSTGYIVLLWMAGSSIVLLIIATLFMRNQIRPIRRLAIAAERFGKGRDVPFFKIEGAREVRQAARAFVEMKSRLQRQIQQRTAMLAGVSHDLRTPLTRMKLQLEMMGGGAEISDLKKDVSDMEKMIGAYLEFARGEGGEEPIRTNLNVLIGHLAQSMNREEQRVHANVPSDLELSLRPVAFERCLGNLLGNALKYGKTAWISAQKFGDAVEICVDDDGPGIPVEQYEDVFKPFFRGEESRNAKTGGVGLGLPIVQDIVHAHGGQIWLDDSPRGGLRVVIDLPV